MLQRDRLTFLALAVTMTLVATPGRAIAQGTTPAAPSGPISVVFVPELRLDLLSSPTAVHGGVGIAVPVSNYFGVALETAGGISSDGFSGRTDLLGRFSLDPYHENPWEPYLGGGATLRYDSGGRGARTYLLGVVGVNAPATGGIAPGVEFGVGGGFRFGVVLRWVGTR